MTSPARPRRGFRRRVYFLFLAASVVGALLVLVLAEGVASFYVAVEKHREGGAWRSLKERKHCQFDDLLGWVNQKGVDVPDLYGRGRGLTTSSRGFRGKREIEDQVPAGKTRIVCTGDSFTLGYGVADPDTFPQQLESLDPSLEVVNMGQGGYGVDQAYLWYRRDATFQHNIHVFAFITSDLIRMTRSLFNGYPKPLLKVDGGVLRPTNTPLPNLEKIRPSRFRFVDNLRLAELIGKWKEESGLSADGIMTEADWQTFETLLAELDQLNKERNSRLCVVYLPEDVTHYGSPISDRPRARIRRFCEGRQIAFIDVVERWKQLPSANDAALLLTYDTGHCNAAGNLFFAQAIHEGLQKQGVLPAGGAKSDAQ
jgi:hypothetical protein